LPNNVSRAGTVSHFDQVFRAIAAGLKFHFEAKLANLTAEIKAVKKSIPGGITPPTR
jgi:hypothetical protein